MDERYKQLYLFRRRLLRHRQLMEMGAPSCVIKDSASLIGQSKQQLLHMGFDPNKYLASPRGQAELLMTETDNKSQEKALHRCHRCVHYWFTGYDTKCGKGVDLAVFNCKAFEDCGEDIVDREQHLVESRCAHCTHVYKSIIDIPGFDNWYNYSCPLGLNMLAEGCPSYVKEV